MENLDQQLIDDLAKLRPICARFGTQAGCKHGRHCKNRHTNDRLHVFDPLRAPYVCRHSDAEGNTYLVAKPPIDRALPAFFEAAGCLPTLRNGHEWTTDDGVRCITYDMYNMAELDTTAIVAAKTTGVVNLKPNGPGKGRTPKFKDGPWLLGHGTTPENGLAICKSGYMKPSEKGKTGAGVYGFSMKNLLGDDLDESDVKTKHEAVFKRVASGGYNRAWASLRGAAVQRGQRQCSRQSPHQLGVHRYRDDVLR